MIKRHSHAWKDPDKNIVYAETPYGQVSFHVFNNEENLTDDQKYGLSPEGRTWSEVTTPSRAADMLDEYIKDATSSKKG